MASNELPFPQLNQTAKTMFPDAERLVNKRMCPLCEATINGRDDFKDQQSINEYLISGMCQECQDETFG